MLLNEILSLLCVYGLCFGLVQDKFPLLPRLRRFKFIDAMWDCSYCTGFQCGLLFLALRWITGTHYSFSTAFTWVFACAGFCVIVDELTQRRN